MVMGNYEDANEAVDGGSVKSTDMNFDPDQVNNEDIQEFYED
jgi:hypothetical protein